MTLGWRWNAAAWRESDRSDRPIESDAPACPSAGAAPSRKRRAYSRLLHSPRIAKKMRARGRRIAGDKQPDGNFRGTSQAMKAVILAGGRGSRLEEESVTRPKPLVEIGDHPILWHILSIYAAHGIKDFIICAGYKGYLIKEYFSRLILYHNDITVRVDRNEITYHNAQPLDWTVTVVDTGLNSATGG